MAAAHGGGIVPSRRSSGPLSIYWHDGPHGDAVEASSGRGVAWLTPNGELLGAEFDDVACPHKSQVDAEWHRHDRTSIGVAERCRLKT